MRNNASLSAMTLALLLAGCGYGREVIQGQQEPPPLPTGIKFQHQLPLKREASYCHGAKCTVTVHVAVDSSGACEVSAEPFVSVMHRDLGQGQGLTMQWIIAPGAGAAGARFRGTGIAFLGNPQAFKLASASARQVEFHNTGAYGIYPYTVQVEVNGTACDPLDPTGVNDM